MEINESGDVLRISDINGELKKTKTVNAVKSK